MINDEFIAPVYTTRHGGVSALADDGNNITQAGGRDTSRGTVSVKRLYGALDISKLAMDASRTDALAVENALVAQTNTLAQDYSRGVNRQMYNDGVGVVSMVRATGGSVGTGTIAVEAISASMDHAPLDVYGTVNGDISPVKYLAKDQVIGVGSAAAAKGTITGITGTSIVSGAPTALATNANDAIFVLDGSGEGYGSAEITGIRAALSSTTGTNTYAGLARNTTAWTPTFGSTSEALTMSRLEDGYLAAREYAGAKDKFVILVNKTLYKRYGDLLTAMRRTVNSADLLGGWKGLEFAAGGGNVGVYLDYDVPDGEVLILNLDTWTLCQVSDVDWLPDAKGEAMHRKSNTILYQSVMIWFMNILCLCPAANAKYTRKTD